MGWFSWKKRDRTLEIIGRHVDRDFTVYPLGEGRVDASAVQSLGDRLGVRFPDEFVDHVCGELPGANVVANETVWPRPEPLDVGPFWTFLYGVHSFTPLPTSEDWMRLDYVGPEFQRETGLKAVPILKVMSDADVFCVDGRGDLFSFDHETNQLSPLEMDFWELLEREIAELVGRKNRLVRERAQR